jgi:hypothetical protein
VEGVTISRYSRALEAALLFALFFFIGRSNLSACSTSVIGMEEVSDHFRVKVLTRGQPVAGLKLELRTIPSHPSKRSQLILNGSTDESGLAEFAGVKAGSYTVDIKHTAFPSSTDILVRSHPRKTTQEMVILEWPNIEIVHVQSAAGLLNGQIKTGNPLSDQAHPVVVPLGEAKLTLLRAASEEIVGSETASVSGAFSFGSAAPGLYLLHVEASENPQTQQIGYDGYVPIEIDSSATALSLNLSIYPPMCATFRYRNEKEVGAQ